MPEEDKPKKEKKDDVKLQHTHLYVGGSYAYKNSSKAGKRLDPENLKELVLMTTPGQASRVNISMPEEDQRVGIYPQHNSPEDFRKELELIPSRTLEPYAHLFNVEQLKSAGFEERICTMTKSRLDRIKAQFSHLSDFAFNQMLDIPRPDKRDFRVWFKVIEKSQQVLIAYPEEKKQETNFVQVIQYADLPSDIPPDPNAFKSSIKALEDKAIAGIKHCTFAEAKPLVINETLVDKFRNLRQIAHLGTKGESEYFNSVERFDDGTVSWIIGYKDQAGVAALCPNGEIVFMDTKLNDAAKLAARNLGAEAVENGEWAGKFSKEACAAEAEPMQEAFKSKVRKQIGQIIDGASIPGLDPIFWI